MGEGGSVQLNEYKVVFYNIRTNMVAESVNQIFAMNPTAAERIAWQTFDERHKYEPGMSRNYFRASVMGAGQ